MKKIKLLLVFSVIFVNGCVTQEGAGFNQHSFINRDLVKYGALPGSGVVADGETYKPEGMIAVGTLSSYRPFAADDYDRAYAKYEREFAGWETSRSPVLSREEFYASIAGWTTLQVFRIPLLMAGYTEALVTKGQENDLDFEPGFAVFLLQTTEDLVAARTNQDGALVIDRLLCRKDDFEHFRECARAFTKGVFDPASGYRFGPRLQPDEDGPRIDINTFETSENGD